MLIATRVLTLRGASGDVEIPVRLYAPEQEVRNWSCRFEIGWPEGAVTDAASGEDAVQALELCLKIIGTLLYTSAHHNSGNLMWLESGKGYGFPVPRTIRDMLVGDDERFL